MDRNSPVPNPPQTKPLDKRNLDRNAEVVGSGHRCNSPKASSNPPMSDGSPKWASTISSTDHAIAASSPIADHANTALWSISMLLWWHE